jgi:NAD-dependent dihydropyrimidine dehydrogenase PreA subunit
MANIVVDRNKCKGHAECIAVCPQEVYELDEENKAVPVNMQDCEECCSCVEACPEQAIWVDACE